VLTFEEARKMVEQHAAAIAAQLQAGPAQAERDKVSLSDAAGRSLAQTIVSDRDLPPFDRATRDGYAVRASDVMDTPATMLLTGEVSAGEHFRDSVGYGDCVAIMTGAAVPAGADAVVMVEFTRRDGERVVFERPVAKSENIVVRGSEAAKGDILLRCGARLDFAAIALAASVGAAEIEVFRKPHVAILSTGNEVVDVAASPAPEQIRNSNAYSLAAQVAAAGAIPQMLPIAPDERQRTRELVARGLGSDILLLSGGVSMGKYDLVEEVLAEFGADIYFTGVNMQPGKPLVFASVVHDGRRRYVFGLPGNPVSTMVTFELFARIMVEALGGSAPSPLMPLSARLAADVSAKTGLTRILPATLSPGEDLYSPPVVTLSGWKGSGDVVSVARSNAWLVVPPNVPQIAAGELVTVLLR